MKIIHIVTMAALALGISQMAYANHDGADGKDGEHMQVMQDADTNKDGVISRDEFMAAHQARAEKMFDKLDANHDGKVDQAERKTARGKMKELCKMKDHKMHEMEPSPDPK